MSIFREQLQTDCRSVGRNVETALLREKPVTGHLPKKRIDELFAPLVDSIHPVQPVKSIKSTQNTEDDNLDDIDPLKMLYEAITRIRKDNISNTHRVQVTWVIDGTIHNKHFIRSSGYIHPENSDDTTVIVIPGKDLETVSSDDWIVHDIQSEYWLEYMPLYCVSTTPEKAFFYDINEAELLTYLTKKNFSLSETIDLIKSLHQQKLPHLSYAVSVPHTLSVLKTIKPGCQSIIKNGKRKGKLCERVAKRNGKCVYHIRFSPY